MQIVVPLESPVTQITRPEKGPRGRFLRPDSSTPEATETGDIGSIAEDWNPCPLNEENEVEISATSLEHPLLLITSTFPPPPMQLIIKQNDSKKIKNQIFLQDCSIQ